MLFPNKIKALRMRDSSLKPVKMSAVSDDVDGVDLQTNLVCIEQFCFVNTFVQLNQNAYGSHHKEFEAYTQR